MRTYELARSAEGWRVRYKIGTRILDRFLFPNRAAAGRSAKAWVERGALPAV